MAVKPGQRGTKTRGHRPIVSGTLLAKVATQRRLSKLDLCIPLRCSERQLYDYMVRKDPIPALKLDALCDFLDLDPDYLVDSRNYLKKAHK